MPTLSERLKSAWAVISGQQLCKEDLELQNECLSIAMMMSLMAQSRAKSERRRQMEQSADTEKSSGPGIEWPSCYATHESSTSPLRRICLAIVSKYFCGMQGRVGILLA